MKGVDVGTRVMATLGGDKLGPCYPRRSSYRVAVQACEQRRKGIYAFFNSLERVSGVSQSTLVLRKERTEVHECAR
jgi:hypothetical protein